MMTLATLDGTPIMLKEGVPLRVGHVLADAVLARKSATPLEQLQAFTLAQELFKMAGGGPWNVANLNGMDMTAFVRQLQNDVAAYGATQGSSLITGQVQFILAYHVSL